MVFRTRLPCNQSTAWMRLSRWEIRLCSDSNEEKLESMMIAPMISATTGFQSAALRGTPIQDLMQGKRGGDTNEPGQEISKGLKRSRDEKTD